MWTLWAYGAGLWLLHPWPCNPSFSVLEFMCVRFLHSLGNCQSLKQCRVRHLKRAGWVDEKTGLTWGDTGTETVTPAELPNYWQRSPKLSRKLPSCYGKNNSFSPTTQERLRKTANHQHQNPSTHHYQFFPSPTKPRQNSSMVALVVTSWITNGIKKSLMESVLK